jgi:hypothetical protein
MLEEDVAVGHRQRLGMADVDLVLADAAFALGRFAGDAIGRHGGAHRRQERLGEAGVEDVVVGMAVVEWGQVAVVAGKGLGIGGAVEVELQLRSERRGKAVPGQACDLSRQDVSHRLLIGRAVGAQGVGQKESGVGLGRQGEARRRQRPQDAVVEAGVIAGDGKVAVRPVVDAGHQEIVRHRHAGAADLVPTAGRQALADQPSDIVGNADGDLRRRARPFRAHPESSPPSTTSAVPLT